MNDPVNHPSHYTEGGFIHAECGEPVEVIDITSKLSFTRGNAVKYLLRAGLKKTAGDTARDIAARELQDLEKASWYLNREIDAVEGKLEELEQDASKIQYGPDHTCYGVWVPQPYSGVDH